jgi:hypothetical protein
MKRLSVCLLFFITCFCINAQSVPCFFQRDTGTVNGEISQSLVELADGSIYVTGIQNNGPHGSDDIALLKFDKCGTVLWIKYYGDTLANEGTFINKTSDGNLVVIGQNQINTDTTAIFLNKLDTAGNVLFKKQYVNSVNQAIKYVKETSDKGFLLCGYIVANGVNNSYTLKTDSLGNVQWQQVIGGSSNKYAQYACETSDKNFIVVGDVNNAHMGIDVEVIKFDKNGNIIWDKYFGDNLNNGSQGIIELSNGDYLFFGETEVPSTVAFDFFIDRIDTAGNDYGRHVFGGTGTDALFNLVEIAGMDLMCTGYSSSYNGGGSDDIVILKTDTAGSIKWLKNIYSAGVDIGYEIKPSVFGGYLVTGLFAKNNNNYFLTRTDTIGNTSAGISTIAREGDVHFYPNPCSDVFYVDVEATQNIEIINVLGECVKKQNLVKGKNTCTINLPAGVYTVVVKQGDAIISCKRLSVQ